MKTEEDCFNIDILDLAMQCRAANLINKTCSEYFASKEPEVVKDNDIFQQAKVVMVKAHLNYMMLVIFREKTKALYVKDDKIRGHLELIAKVFALESLVKDSAAVFDSGFFGKGAGALLTRTYALAVSKLRPQLIPLAESFYIPDTMMPSVIGNSYGDIYEL